MARPRVYVEPRVATAVRLPVSLREQLQEVAEGRDVSVNYLVTRAVMEYLRRLTEPDRTKKHPTTKKANHDRR